MRLPSGLNAALRTASSWPRTSRSRRSRQAPSSCDSASGTKVGHSSAAASGSASSASRTRVPASPSARVWLRHAGLVSRLRGLRLAQIGLGFCSPRLRPYSAACLVDRAEPTRPSEQPWRRAWSNASFRADRLTNIARRRPRDASATTSPARRPARSSPRACDSLGRPGAWVLVRPPRRVACRPSAMLSRMNVRSAGSISRSARFCI